MTKESDVEVYSAGGTAGAVTGTGTDERITRWDGTTKIQDSKIYQ